ncbi:hypothetical protein [Halorubrum sp. F4]|uniref:hypothetical protein n=1 Tax=Halorubrum sp. F4 TaxID=2989715 RepID=UPI0024808494|nr:hypothetical protein [Halorubrum sp. F4]
MSRYNLSNFKRAIQNPEHISGELSHIGTKINSRFQKKLVYRDKKTDPISKDWDNLIILDACRIDAYQKVIGDDSVDSHISNSTHSWEFMKNNFQGRTLHDTIYITANPFTTRLDKSIFFKLDYLPKHSWNEEKGTVMPGDVLQTTLNTHKNYPHKKLIIHFMQPHYPFIGDIGDSIDHTGYNRDQDDVEDTAPNIWWVLQYASKSQGVTTREVWEAYIQNLEIVLEYAQKIVDSIPGKTVLTADHGTMIGDRTLPVPVRGYGHAHGSFVTPVVKVPWDVRDYNDRKIVRADSPIDTGEKISKNINQQLESLGYKP